MPGVSVQVDDSRVRVSFGQLRLSLAQNQELMARIGASMLLSIRKTFRESGSPAGSWVPLSPNTIRRNPRKYGAGHKLLIQSGNLLNSIGWEAQPGAVTIGTALKYAAVHQFGSRDRGGVAIGPVTKAASESMVKVPARSYYRQSAELGKGSMGGRRRKIFGPRNAQRILVRKHDRHQNIPPRPYLVFRPEDPQRIRGIVVRYVNQAVQQAGLGGAL